MMNGSFRKIRLIREFTSAHRALVIICILLLLVALVAGGASYYLFTQYQGTQMLLKNPKEAARKELSDTIAKVGKLAELPSGEEPNIASVVDKEKLRDQPFFQGAENGDKVLIYTKAKKAILYRPKTNKIVHITFLDVGPGTAFGEGTKGAVATKTIRIALYNGTSITGLTLTAEKRLKVELSGVDVVFRENAKSKEYKESLVVVISEAFKDEASKVAELVNGKVSELPNAEAKPASADILVILGANFK